MRNYINLIIRYRFLVLGLLLILTILSGNILSKVKISGSMPDLFLGKSPKYLSYQERVKEFGSDALIVLAFEDKSLLSKSSIEKLKKVESKVKALSKIKDMKSVLDLQDVRVTAGMPRAERYVDMALRQPERSGAILDIMRNEPLFSGLWISKDGVHSAVVIELDDEKIQTDMEVPPLLEEIINIFEENGFDRAGLHKGGQVPLVVEWLYQTEFNIRKLFPIVCLVLLLTVFILFQRFWPVFITFIVTLIGVSWTMGLAVILFGQINMMTAIVPGIIMIIAFSDVVHLCSSYHMELSKGERKEQAIEKSCSEVGAACLFTSITTFFGFVSLALAPSPVSRQLGVVLGVGVGISLIIAITLTPIIFSLMKVPKPLRVGGASKPQLLLYQFTDFLVQLTRKRPWVIVTLFCLLLAFTVMGIARIEFETDVTKRMAEDNQIRIDAQYFADHFSGTNYIDIFLEASGPREILEPEIISRIAAFQNSLLNIPEVDNVMSILGYFNYMHRIFNPGTDQFTQGIDQANLSPLTEEDISKYLLMLNMSGSDLLRGMIDKENKAIRMRLSINTSGYFATHRISREATAAGLAILGDEVDIEVTGIWALLGEWITKFMKGQRRGLIFAFLTIFLMMSLALRSFSGGLWSMLPNMIPLLFLGGYVGWFWDSVDTDTYTIAVIAIGISVDDTIHFLFRYRFERERTSDISIALDRTFHFSGRAIIITSVILVAGFLPFSISEYFSIRIMGTLLPATLLMALATDLLLVPAMIKLGAFKFRSRALQGATGQIDLGDHSFEQADFKIREGLPKGDLKELEKKMAVLKKSPNDAMTASRVGYLLNKAGRSKDASSYLWMAFRSFVKTGQYSMSVMVADELLSIHHDNVEILHLLSQISDQKDIEIPVLEVYKKYKGFHGLPLFSILKEMEFLQLLKVSRYHAARKNSIIIKEGAKGDDIFLIVQGSVKVTKKTNGKKEILLGRLSEGDFLGEIAFISDKRRSATIIADQSCQLLSWKGRAIKELNERHPHISTILFQAFWERSLDTVLSLSPLFTHLDKDERKKIIKKFRAKSYAPEEVILKEGEENPEGMLYIIKKGEAAVFSKGAGDIKNPSAILKVGDIFGEYSALSNKACTATVMSRVSLEVLTLNRADFIEIIKKDKLVSKMLEEIGKERLDESLLQMSYFQLIPELKDEKNGSSPN